MSPRVTIEWSMKQIVEWPIPKNKRLQPTTHPISNLQQQRVRWQCPSAGTLKMNVDAAVTEGQQHFSVGLVLRDHQGQFIIGKTRKFAGSVQVVEAETIAILEALSWLEDLQVSTGVIKSDSLLSVIAINRRYHNYLELGSWVHHCKSIIHRRVGYSVVHVRKQANKVAHQMAKIPCKLNSFVIMSSPPLSLLETLLSDASLN
ncbi:uncharacterized protein LOC108207639 [Daucus carota subsp. sativus]|uniref:uncharacterized protein LOC108207639 n=1 Tax=Daucus carota subsp. sativus TaxID=79200 RepID=UPI0007EF4975|nr:PREDICTED: uncharacterized protein LOC108207639 [Daucus carota subsp. sativus]